jgi:hypothetical protein
MGFAFAGWAQAALPHRRLPDDQPWQLFSKHLTLVVEPGCRTASGGKLFHVGVPFGLHARPICSCRPRCCEQIHGKPSLMALFGNGLGGWACLSEG